MASTPDVLTAWLLDADPSLRWQVERDIVGSPPDVWERTRARVATEGFGAELLSHQDEDGQWAGGAYFPAGWFASGGPKDPDQPWTATTWPLKDLREAGLDPSHLAGTAERLDAVSRWEYNDKTFWCGEVCVCINAFTLASGAWLGADVSGLAKWFVENRLADGGWNCDAADGDSVRSSFHSTLNAVQGLLDYERLTGDDSVRDARLGGERYLLERGLMRRLSTGEQVGDFVTDFVHPRRWSYNALAALDYFRDAAQFDSRGPDPRLADAIDVVRSARRPDGTWVQGHDTAGAVWAKPDDVRTGEPSRALTLMGIRVLAWWEEAAQDESVPAAGA